MTPLINVMSFTVYFLLIGYYSYSQVHVPSGHLKKKTELDFLLLLFFLLHG